jgi:CRISPR-associated protein Csd1
MILQSLVELYDRRVAASNPGDRPAPVGFEFKEIGFLVELDEDGGLIQLADVRRKEGKRWAGKTELVPQSVKRASNVAANLLWDTAEYALGCEVELKTKRSDPERVKAQHLAFVQRIRDLPEAAREDAGVRAVLRFLESSDASRLASLPAWEDIRTGNPVVSFRLRGDVDLVCQRPAVRQAWLDLLGSDAADGFCLASGEPAVLERLHPSIKGVWGAQSSGANVVSFNLDAFNSYGKSQGANAPVGRVAAAKYTTALNQLLARESRQRIQVGDASTVFWAQRRSPLEEDFLLFIGATAEDDPAAGTDRVRQIYESVRSGDYLQNVRGEDRFFVLGLAPNAARIAVRFWHVGTIADTVKRFARWFEDTAIAHHPSQPPRLSLFRLLTACAVQGKADNIPPRLGGDVLRAVLDGSPYPQAWLQAAVVRCRAERDVGYARAAAIKACLNRRSRSEEEKLAVSLDPANTHVAYRLGRLFAVLERIQEEANPGLNATIRERYFGAASSNPQSVFPTLNRLKNHHLAKLENRGRVRNLERLVGEIFDGLPGDSPFPPVLTLADQGRFAVGYYHQRQHPSTYGNQADKETAA